MLTFIGKHDYHPCMKKNQAIQIFGSVPNLASAIGVTRHAIYQWPDELSQRTSDEVVGAAMRLGLPLDTDEVSTSDWPDAVEELGTKEAA
jgi:predicted transcriptional regulator